MVRRLCVSVLVAASSCCAFAQQWTAIRLQPPGAESSDVYAVTATQQGGTYTPPPFAQAQAGIWSGSATSWTLLSPPQYSCDVRGMDGSSQVGTVFGAALWHGTPESRVDLAPVGSVGSTALAVRGSMQAGAAFF